MRAGTLGQGKWKVVRCCLTSLPSFSHENCILRLAGQSPSAEAVGMKHSPEHQDKGIEYPSKLSYTYGSKCGAGRSHQGWCEASATQKITCNRGKFVMPDQKQIPHPPQDRLRGWAKRLRSRKFLLWFLLNSCITLGRTK